MLDDFSTDVGISRRYDKSLTVTAPVKPTEEMIDAPRNFLMGLELGIMDCEKMRKHLRMGSTNEKMFPTWFLTARGHISKAGQASIIYHMMINAIK